MGVIFQHEDFYFHEFRIADVPELFERFFSNPKIVQYLPIVAHTNVEQTLEMAARYLSIPELRGVVLRRGGSERIAGLFTVAKHEHSIALSIMTGSGRHSAGAGRIAGPAFCHWLLAHKEIRRLWCYTDVDNIGVANMLVKGGAHCEGWMRKYAVHPNISPEPRDCLLWSFVR